MRRLALAGLFGGLLVVTASARAQGDPDEDEPVNTALPPEDDRDDRDGDDPDGGAEPEPEPEEPDEEREVDGLADLRRPHREAGDTAAEAEKADEDDAEAKEELDVRKAAQLGMGPVTISPFVLVRVHANPYVGDEAFFQTGDIAENEGFRLRYGRLGIHTTYEEMARIRVSVDLGGNDDGGATIHDAYAGFTPFEWAQLLVGSQTVPFSRYELIRSGRGALIEAPFATRALAPGHQVGVVGRGWLWDGALGYQLGVFNGLQRGNVFYQGYQENYAPFGNRFDGLLYVVRLSSDPLGRLPRTAADEEQGPARLGVGANYMFSDGGARDVHTGGGDIQFMWRGLHLIAEGLFSRTVPESEPTTEGALPFAITSYTVVAEGGYMILPRMLGLATRFEWIDPNIQTADETDNWMFTGGAAFHFVDQLLKAQLEYTHREERHGLSLDNDTLTLSLQGQLDPARPRGVER